MNRQTNAIFAIILITIGFSLFSCREDGIDTDPSIQLQFSSDSILFDTIFTTVGSASRSFKVINNHHKRINISSITLAGGSSSYFRINVDGASGLTVRDVEIGAKDSIFVFVEVTVDPVSQQLPLVIADSLIFTTNGNIQDVKLVAWGQDAHFIYPNYADEELGIQYHIIGENTVWDNSLPYVVYGLAVVAPGVTLSITEGANIHFHNNASLIFLAQSTMNVQGSGEAPVSFQGDRLENFYKDVPGQWGRIWLTATSKDHFIDHAIIKNGTIGLHVDTIGSTSLPTLTIRNTVILNMSITGLLAQGSHVVAENMVIANCGQHAAVLALGGNYQFTHCTFANYYTLQSRRSPSILINNYYEDVNGVPQIRSFEKLSFSNSIIYGSLAEELGFDFYPGTQVAYQFDHCLIRTETSAGNPAFTGVILNQTPQFRDTRLNDYRLNENSPAISKGNPAISLTVPFDLLGQDRTQRSDIGAYQYYLIEEEDQ